MSLATTRAGRDPGRVLQAKCSTSRGACRAVPAHRTRSAPRGLRIHPADTREFQRRLEDAFDLLAERYYLHLSGEPKVTVGRDAITVRFPVEKDD